MLWIILAILATALSRYRYWYRFSEVQFAGDALSHLLMVKHIRQNNGLIPQKLPQFILNWNDYPQGFHKLIAHLPLSLESIQRYGGLISAVIDVLLLCFISLIIVLYGGPHMIWLIFYPFIRLFWGKDMRAINFGERPFGTLMGVLYITCSYLWIETHHWPWLLTAFVGFFGFSVSSKFAWQAVTFLTLLLSLYLRHTELLTVFLGCLTLTCILTRGYVLQVLQGSIAYLSHYQRHRQARWLFRGYYQELLRAFYRFKQSRFNYYFFENPLYMVFSNCPPTLIFVIASIRSPGEWTIWTFTILAAFLLVVLTALKPLRFLGQPERYMEYAVLPLFVELSRLPLERHETEFWLAGLISLYAFVYNHNRKKESIGKDIELLKSFQELEDFLEKLEPSRLITIPLKVAFELGYRLEKHQYLCNFSHCQNKQQYTEYESLMSDFYPFPHQRIEDYARPYNLQYLVVYKDGLAYINEKTQCEYYDFSNYKHIFKNKHFNIYRLPQKDTPIS